ncbi:MAG TPA: SMP-30/gluconolactonase/LRE family protein [Polyangia bacterium]|jgi:sugar lactone lactonase YvrE|nr:SMP-30/gluconolactonase/LRE family protein [Polyangia bacterium]
MKSISPVLVSALALLAGCSNGGGGSTPDSGSGGASAGGSGGTSTGTGGAQGSGGGASGGASGTGGSIAGTGGAIGTGGAADGGTDMTTADSGSDASTAYKPFTCPPGPFLPQNAGTTTNICNGFKYNYGYNEGPTWIASQNAFFFSNFVQGDKNVTNFSSGDIIKYTLGGSCEVWLHDVGCNGLGVSANGNLLGACHGPRAVMEYDVITKQGKALATMAGGQMLDSPNDLISHTNGTIYFSNTIFELGTRPQALGSALVMISPAGMTTVIQKGGLNGMALSPDQKTLYVVGMGVWNLDDNGTPTTKTSQAGPGGDGIGMDCAKNLINTAENYGTNVAFGGPDGKTMIAVGNGASGSPTAAKIIQMTVPGFP